MFIRGLNVCAFCAFLWLKLGRRGILPSEGVSLCSGQGGAIESPRHTWRRGVRKPDQAGVVGRARTQRLPVRRIEIGRGLESVDCSGNTLELHDEGSVGARAKDGQVGQ